MSEARDQVEDALDKLRAKYKEKPPEHTPQSAFVLGMSTIDVEQMKKCAEFLEDCNVHGAAAQIRTRLHHMGVTTAAASFPKVDRTRSYQQQENPNAGPIVGMPGAPIARFNPHAATQENIVKTYGANTAQGAPVGSVFIQGQPAFGGQPQLGGVALPVAQPKGLSDEEIDKMMNALDSESAGPTAALFGFHGRTDLVQLVKERYPGSVKGGGI